MKVQPNEYEKEKKGKKKEKKKNPRRYAGKSKSMCKKTINGKSQDRPNNIITS